MPERNQTNLRVLISIFFIIVMPAQAITFDDLEDEFVSDVLQLPAIDDAMLKPDKIEQSSKHIHGWIDIVGFKECTRMNEMDYLNTSPSNNAIVRYDAWGVKVSVDSIKKDVVVYDSGNNTIARMNVVLKWHYYYSCNCGEDGCSTCRKDVVEHAVFYDSEVFPVQYPASSISELIVHEYPNSSKVLIEVSVGDTVTSYNVSTQNGSVKKHIQIGHVEYTAKGVQFANFTNNNNYSIWDDMGIGVYHQGNDVVVDDKNFTFTAHTPFGTTSEVNITRIFEKPTSMSSLNILIVFMLGLGYVVCKLVWKVARI